MYLLKLHQWLVELMLEVGGAHPTKTRVYMGKVHSVFTAQPNKTNTV
jgi:hypothetical protein